MESTDSLQQQVNELTQHVQMVEHKLTQRVQVLEQIVQVLQAQVNG